MNILQTNAPKWQNANSSSMMFMSGDSALGDSAPKGQGALSPGQRPGIRVGHRHTPCKGKSRMFALSDGANCRLIRYLHDLN